MHSLIRIYYTGRRYRTITEWNSQSFDQNGWWTNLESRIVEFPFTKLLKGIANLPFVNSLSALKELIKLLSNTHFWATILEQSHIKRFFQVLFWPFCHALAASQLQQCHCNMPLYYLRQVWTMLFSLKCNVFFPIS